MVRGLETFKKYFAPYAQQYVLIGGTACDILYTHNERSFRATRDLDIVLIVEALTPEFGRRFWEFVIAGKYRISMSETGHPRFYRFDHPEKDTYPKMIELFSRTDFAGGYQGNIVPIHVDAGVSSLSAILLNEDYYQALLAGRVFVDGFCVLRPEYLLLFKAKAFLDLSERKQRGEQIDTGDIKKHKNDVLRLAADFVLKQITGLPQSVHSDMCVFITDLQKNPFDKNMLKTYGLSNEDIIEKLNDIFK